MKPFLFDLDFGPRPQEAAAPSEVEAPPPPTFSAEEVAAARQQGFEDGRGSAAAEGTAAVERQIVHLLSEIRSQLTEVADEQRRANATIAREATQVALKLVRKLLPAYAERHGLAEIEALVADCVGIVPQAGEMTVVVAVELAEEATGRLVPVAAAAGFAGDLRVQGDAALGPAECRVRWTTGGAERSEARIWQEVEAVLARTLPHLGDTTSPSPAMSSPPAAEGAPGVSAEEAATATPFPAPPAPALPAAAPPPVREEAQRFSAEPAVDAKPEVAAEPAERLPLPPAAASPSPVPTEAVQATTADGGTDGGTPLPAQPPMQSKPAIARLPGAVGGAVLPGAVR